MVIRLSGPIATAVVCGLLVTRAYAQDPGVQSAAPAPAPANLAYSEGAVDVIQDGVTERADPPVMLLEGDVVRTRNGRAEIVFGDGSLLHLAQDSELEILATGHLRLVTGRVIVRVTRAAASPYAIDTPSSTIRLEAEGEYSILTDRTAGLEVAVTRGAATVHETTAWALRGGQLLTIAGPGARPLIQSFNSARFDGFTQWAYDRVNGYARSSSAAQLPYELRPYGPVLDQYGYWDQVAPYGPVWYPTVDVGWRPYYDGSWAFTRFGWTWRGRDRWAWPTHHYGRWGYNANRWFWIPAASWGPAWVSWSVAGGFVGWSPLGWDGHPSIGFWGRRDHPAYRPDYSPWRSWTVVRRDHFAPRWNVRANAIDGDRLDERTRLALANAVPLRPTGDVAVPRNSVSAPGVRGNVRRPPPPQPSRPANETVFPNGTRAVAPAAPATTDTVTPGVRSRRPVSDPYAPPRTTDDPYAPPRTWNSGDARRGSVRDPQVRDPRVVEGSGLDNRQPGAERSREVRDPRASEGSGRELHPTTPSPRGGDPGLHPTAPGVSSPIDGRNEPRSAEPRAIPRSDPRPSTSGGSNRGEGREPRAAAPQPAPPPSSAPAPSERGGGAVERSGASRREPTARGDLATIHGLPLRRRPRKAAPGAGRHRERCTA